MEILKTNNNIPLFLYYNTVTGFLKVPGNNNELGCLCLLAVPVLYNNNGFRYNYENSLQHNSVFLTAGDSNVRLCFAYYFP